MIIDPYRSVPLTGPLDAYSSGLWGAWAPYRLLGSFGSAYVRVRRASDDAEADCSSDSAIIAHCGASVGHVVTLYDQTGNGRHATTSSNAEQPVIYDGSSIVTVIGGVPTMLFNGSGNVLRLPDMASSGLTTVELFAAGKRQADPPTITTKGGPLFSSNTITGLLEHYPWTDSNVYFGPFRDARSSSNPTTSLASVHVYNCTSLSGGQALTVRVDSEQLYNQALGNFTLANNGISGYPGPTIGGSGGVFFDGHIGAVLLYSAVKTDRADIRVAIS